MKSDDPAPLVVVPEADDEDLKTAREALGESGELERLASDDTERREQLRSARALLVFAWRLQDDEIPFLGSTGLIQSVWAGVDRLPINRLREHHPGIQIASGSGPNAAPVAEHAVGLYLDCAKRITQRDRDMRKGGWMQELPGQRIESSRIAVVGMGAIGARVARTLLALGAHVTGVTRTGQIKQDGLKQQVEGCTLEALRDRIGEHDGAILCLPLTDETEGFVDRGFLRAMKNNAILVNIARGKIIDANALYDHLQENPRFTAGIDVWWRYPKHGKPRSQGPPFEELDNIVMTPHSAFNVPGGRTEMIENATRNVARYLRGETPHNLV